MADPLANPLSQSPPAPTGASEDPPAAGRGPDLAGRYDANLQLILRRLADQHRTQKPRRWWQGR